MTISLKGKSQGVDRRLDPVLLPVIANRLDSIVREMTMVLLRSSRSAIINTARDFSCSIVTANDELLSAAEGLPIHILGSGLQTREMRRLHPDLREGDAFLDNDPYAGNTHHADHTILVPVFVEGQHLFTAVAKAHQADIGNSQPTTYMANARDIYEEGALNFPCVQVQRDNKDIDDIIRMCRRRIRVPEVWYGDYLGMLGAARTAELRLKELAIKYGVSTLQQFIREWFDYSERLMIDAISRMRSGHYERQGQHDPMGSLPAIPIKVQVSVDAAAAQIEVDLRDNPDCVPFGLNMTWATSTNSALAGVFNSMSSDLPCNEGSFRRVKVLLRENCVVGIPRHPTCCSVATTNVANRVISLTQAAFEGAGPEQGVAEGGAGPGLANAVISGIDWRTGESYINQVAMALHGGPGTSESDGWPTWMGNVTAGLMYRDSVEVDERKYPIRFCSIRLLTDTGGAGCFRGGLAGEVSYIAVGMPMTVMCVSDNHVTPARGIHGGGSGSLLCNFMIDSESQETVTADAGRFVLKVGDYARTTGIGGGGFGDPMTRRPGLVLDDVREGYVSRDMARDVYGVAITGSASDDTLEIDQRATNALRRRQLDGVGDAPGYPAQMR